MHILLAILLGFIVIVISLVAVILIFAAIEEIGKHIPTLNTNIERIINIVLAISFILFMSYAIGTQIIGK